MNSETELRETAVALRRAGLSRSQIRDRLGIRSDERLGRLLQGEPPPEWTKRPRAKDDLRERARELRVAGRTYDEISEELGVSKSSVSLWVRDLPRPAPRMTPEEKARHMSEARWGPLRLARDQQRRATKAAAQAGVGEVSERDLFLVGVALYWAEGTKDKSYARREKVRFINSDPAVLSLYLAWLDLLGVERSRLRFTVSIHASADVPAAERYWADHVGGEAAQFCKTALKHHNPRTARKNVGTDYRGCLTISVLDGADLYRRIEGWWAGIVEGATKSPVV